jgi:hypothetical protein
LNDWGNYISGKCYYGSGQYGSAIANLIPGAYKGSLKGDVYYLIGQSYLALNNYKGAMFNFVNAVNVSNNKTIVCTAINKLLTSTFGTQVKDMYTFDAKKICDDILAAKMAEEKPVEKVKTSELSSMSDSDVLKQCSSDLKKYSPELSDTEIAIKCDAFSSNEAIG